MSRSDTVSRNKGNDAFEVPFAHVNTKELSIIKVQRRSSNKKQGASLSSTLF